MNIVIVGAGAWGTGLAIALSAKHTVALLVRDPVQAARMAATRCNERYLAEAVLPVSIRVGANLSAAIADADLGIVATPTEGLRKTLAALREAKPGLPVVWACKGFERATGRLPHEIAEEELGNRVPCAALSGPSFAIEVANGLPTAVTLASRDGNFARATARELHQHRFRVYYSTDLVGVEVGGGVKNVMAIATGICDGLGLGMNARAAVITRGLAELTRLGVALGGRPETFMGLAGAGDLILTCTGDLSRNRRVGLMLAQGRKLADILAALGHVAEGVFTAREVQRIATERAIEMPITQAVCSVLFREVPPREAVNQLLERDPREEI